MELYTLLAPQYSLTVLPFLTNGQNKGRKIKKSTGFINLTNFKFPLSSYSITVHLKFPSLVGAGEQKGNISILVVFASGLTAACFGPGPVAILLASTI